MSPTDDIPAYLDARRVLDEAVRIATGLSSVTAREGQVQLMDDIADTFASAGANLAGLAPTGVGKAFAYLVPAAIAAAKNDARTLISTESLALQSQLIDKDFPAVACAIANLGGPEIRCAVLKGWSNYGCLQASGGVLDRGGSSAADAQALQIASWVIQETATGDRAELPYAASEESWSQVSVSTDACLGSKCPLVADCFAYKARQSVLDAHIVITNHSMMALQAAKKVPVVSGGRANGNFDHIVIDEAHTLASEVRKMGAAKLSGPVLVSLARSVQRFMGAEDTAVAMLCAKVATVAEAMDAGLRQAAMAAGGDGAGIAPECNPIQEWEQDITDVLSEAMVTIARRRVVREGDEIALRRMKARIEKVAGAVQSLTSPARAGVARWFEVHDSSVTVHSSPIEVASSLRVQVFSAPACPDPAGERDLRKALRTQSVISAEDMLSFMSTPSVLMHPAWKKGGVAAKDLAARLAEFLPRRPLPVVAVSATLPASFCAENGLNAAIRRYDSPFGSAYEASLLYVPRPEVQGRPVPRRGRSLDTSAHATWALEIMQDLIEANGGSALVLSSTSRAGQFYASELQRRSEGRFAVYSQWNGMSKAHNTASWKKDVSSVLVGTRSYMTGVDAQGETCSLVIVDRVPRSAGNVVDDARVEVLVKDGVSEFVARNKIYAMDAACLLQQAAGRLIRSVTDGGMVAILDPRLLKGKEISYPASTRKIYLSGLDHFTRRSASHDTAISYLRQARDLRLARAS